MRSCQKRSDRENFWDDAGRHHRCRLQPPNFREIRSDIREEIQADRNGLNALREVDAPGEASIRRFLQVEIAVLQARLAYPTDEVLEQLDQMLDTRTSLGREAKRNILARLHARLRELKAGG
jgi:hypothetical protein